MDYACLDTSKKRRVAKLFKKQKGLCWLCGWAMMLPTAGQPIQYTATLDHILPRSEGGSNSIKNMAAAHYTCNTDRQSEMRTREAHLQSPRVQRLIVNIQSGQMQNLINELRKRSCTGVGVPLQAPSTMEHGVIGYLSMKMQLTGRRRFHPSTPVEKA